MPDKKGGMSTESDRRDRFERMFHAHYGPVHAYALRRAEPSVAQDVVAETFTVAWRRLEFVPGAELPWLSASLGGSLRMSCARSDAGPPSDGVDHRDGLAGVPTR